jgi:hypothetical protein
MEITAIFESWHLGDGNYPPLHRGQLVRLSFELEPKNLEPVDASQPTRLEHLGQAEYRGVGVVTRRYGTKAESLAVIDANGFRFYVYRTVAAGLTPGQQVEFEGTLLLDHYIWVEFLHEYPDPPDLFYNLCVSRIVEVGIPDRLVSRQGKNKSYPTRVGLIDFGAVNEIETMEDTRGDEEFFIVTFDSSGAEDIDVPLTFR